MKKFLSLALVICMLLTTCLTLASCSKVNEKKVEENPQAVLGDALDKAGADFFTGDKEAAAVIADALKKGSVTLTVESTDLKEEIGLGKIVVTEYFDAENQKSAANLLVNFNDQDLSAKIFADKNGLIVNSEDVFGSANSYGIYPASISEKLFTSEWAKMLGLSSDNVSGVAGTLIDQIDDLYKSLYETDSEKMDADMNAILALLNQTTTTEKVDIGEKKVNCVVISYTFDNKTVRALMEKMVASMGVTDEEMKNAIKETLDEMDENVTFALTAKVCINKKSGALAKVLLDGTVTEKRVIVNILTKEETIEEHVTTVNGELALSDTEIALTINTAQDGESGVAALKLTKTEEKKVTTYKLTATEKKNDEAEKELMALTYVFNAENGDFTVSGKTTDTTFDDYGTPKTEEQNFAINGNLTADKTTATISIKSIKFGETTLELKELSLKFDSAAEIPAAPTDAKDVVTMSAEDIQKFMEDFQKSKLAGLFMSEIN